MPPSTDLYEMLGVERSASQEQIRKAYLKLAREVADLPFLRKILAP